MKKLFSILAVLLAFSACSESESTKDKVDEIFLIHDEAMPKIGELMSLKKQVLSKAQEVENPDSLRGIANDLEKAQQGMMTWMNEWASNSQPYVNEEANKDEIEAYLKAEKEKVTKVREDINNSIAAAKKVLEQN